jgi:hypothetical protein
MYPDINSSNSVGDKNNSDKVTLLKFNDVFVHADTEHIHVDDQHITIETNDKQVTN